MTSPYLVEFPMTISTTRCIMANSEEQALKIADALIRNRKYEEDLYGSVLESMVYDEFDNPKVVDWGEGLLPDYDDDDYQEIYGIDMKALRREAK